MGVRVLRVAVGSVLLVGVMAVAGCSSDGAEEDSVLEVGAIGGADGRREPIHDDVARRTFCDELEDPVYKGIGRSERELEVQASAVDLARRAQAPRTSC